MLGWIGRDEDPVQMEALPEQSAANDNRKAALGVCAGTVIAAEKGWQPIETLRPGDRVMTFDRGLQPLLGIERQVLWPSGRLVPREDWPLLIPAGALDNRYDLLLPPDQPLLVECDEQMSGSASPFLTVPVSALEGVRGITRSKPTWDQEVFTLSFAGSEHVYAEGGALIFSPANRAEAAEITLSLEEAAIVARCFMVEDPSRARLGWSGDPAATGC